MDPVEVMFRYFWLMAIPVTAANGLYFWIKGSAAAGGAAPPASDPRRARTPTRGPTRTLPSRGPADAATVSAAAPESSRRSRIFSAAAMKCWCR